MIWVEKKQPPPNRKRSNSKESPGRSGLNDYLKYAGMGFQMLAIILILTWVGIKLDERSSGDKPLFTAFFALLGVVIGIYTILKDFIGKQDE